ncbi:hypothetical protein CDL15_Pgr018944 [Punica granatum]|uniref:Uncharacterized protein n=1 Tax=Punica granatum TaxID=22663 RepID=A0A218WM16_PUNGR|nr:hypothetical protein CDL15_Pgr018944 [Punica granatum]
MLQANVKDFSHAALEAGVVAVFVNNLTVGTPSRLTTDDKYEELGATVFARAAKTMDANTLGKIKYEAAIPRVAHEAATSRPKPKYVWQKNH